MSNSRKFYVIGYQDNDLLHAADDGYPDCTYMAPGLLPVALRGGLGTITADALRSVGFQPLDNMHDGAVYLTVPRRALARKIVAHLKAIKHHNHDEYSVIEVGTFNRTTRPVMHWNIVHYSTGQAKGTKGAKFRRIGTSQYGIPLRVDARAEAKRLTEAAKNDGSYYEHKWVAEPVYAGGK